MWICLQYFVHGCSFSKNLFWSSKHWYIKLIFLERVIQFFERDGKFDSLSLGRHSRQMKVTYMQHQILFFLLGLLFSLISRILLYLSYMFESLLILNGSSGNCHDLVHFSNPNVKLKKFYHEHFSYIFPKKSFPCISGWMLTKHKTQNKKLLKYPKMTAD